MEHETFSNIDARLQKLWLLRIITFHCRFYFDHQWTFNFGSASQVKRPFIQTFQRFVAPLESVSLVPKNITVTTWLRSIMWKPLLETILALSLSIFCLVHLTGTVHSETMHTKNITYNIHNMTGRSRPCSLEHSQIHDLQNLPVVQFTNSLQLNFCLCPNQSQNASWMGALCIWMKTSAFCTYFFNQILPQAYLTIYRYVGRKVFFKSSSWKT